MGFKPGEGGRPVGAVNKTTKLVKEVFAEVFAQLQDGGEADLKIWAKENPTEFYKLASKLIPVQIGGDPENPIGLPDIKIYNLAPPLASSEDDVDFEK